ncbi:hypothetical protein RSOLAG1IB_09889 [Rhizoctonia solani AG-1 IB]|uniref:Transmembrane protein n=1 Tax=Thanatephorus cucumeris (strain AG1-IB / isolate 7/3/14) TaxID=1108050 RepID=A0A0B7FYL2_THACB|nr:hypothetical protein RSOLAG1IB_09889 [Rhizoctonia solani AG-1 IB]
MLAFSRLTTFLLFVLSLSFLTCAAPTSGKAQELSIREDNCSGVVTALAQLEAKLKVHLDACAQIDAKVGAEDLIVKVKADIDATVQAVVSVNVHGNVEGKVKTEIIGRIAAIITIVAKILIKLSAKLSVSVMAQICVQIDACLKALLLSLNVLIPGIVSLSLNAIVDLTVIVFIKVKLVLCAEVLGLLKVHIN